MIDSPKKEWSNEHNENNIVKPVNRSEVIDVAANKSVHDYYCQDKNK